MTQKYNLADMVKGKIYQVVGYAQAASDYANKLHKMGFVIGTKVEMAPVKISDPMVVQIRGSRVALRRKEAQEVFVEELYNA